MITTTSQRNAQLAAHFLGQALDHPDLSTAMNVYGDDRNFAIAGVAIALLSVRDELERIGDLLAEHADDQ
jgi:hypothetical protein